MIKIFNAIFAALFFLSVGGCSDAPREKSAVDVTIDYATGKTPVEGGRKAASEIKNISKSRSEDIQELGF